MRTSTVAAAVAALAATLLAGCSSGTTPGVPSDGLTTTTTSSTRPAEPVRATMEFDGLTVEMTVPGRLGEGELRRMDLDECTRQDFSWGLTPSDAGDPGELLAVSTTDRACPDEQAVNGRFPTWSTASQLPEDAAPTQTPVGEGHTFTLDYTQCTNECNDFTYDVVFVEAGGGKSFWIQSAGLDDATVNAMLSTLDVR